LTKSKIGNFFKSFRNKALVVVSLLVIAGVLVVTKYYLGRDDSGVKNSSVDSLNDSGKKEVTDIAEIDRILERGIDSVLGNFGIKKEWITTSYTDAKHTTKDSEWFSKNVLIPTELSSIEVNADLSSYFRHLGFSTMVNEDILTKNITIAVTPGDTLKHEMPLAVISVKHSDKVHRDNAVICVIISNIGDYKDEEIDKLLINKTEFSYIFPRSLDEIDLQNKLLHSKKDVLINLTIGGKENYDTDFNTDLDDKALKEKVKSFTSDFPLVRSVVLTRSGPEVPQSEMNLLADELGKYNITVLGDNDLSKLLTQSEEESTDKLNIITSNIRSKAVLTGSMITMLKITPDEFPAFYDQISVLKKLGYRFFDFSEFYNRKTEMEKKKKEQEEKLKQEQTDKKQQEKKRTEIKKKTETKKKTDTKKPTDKKKTQSPTNKNEKKK
jgi:hypothetical protein